MGLKLKTVKVGVKEGQERTFAVKAIKHIGSLFYAT